MPPSFLAVPIAYGVKFFVYDFLLDNSARLQSDWIPNLAFHSLCGAAGATVAVTAIHPFDVARRRMQLARLAPETEKFG
jgi:hypothetical protein